MSFIRHRPEVDAVDAGKRKTVEFKIQGYQDWPDTGKEQHNAARETPDMAAQERADRVTALLGPDDGSGTMSGTQQHE